MQKQGTQQSQQNMTFRILISTDNHLGYKEKDEIIG
jgi:hypothetical protein